MTDPTSTTLSDKWTNKQRMFLHCLGRSVMSIRDITDDPVERAEIARKAGNTLVLLVNDATWDKKRIRNGTEGSTITSETQSPNFQHLK